MSQWTADIVAAANQYGVDPALALAVANQESGQQQYTAAGSVLKSGAGALGIMQLMPSTAAGLGVDPTDPLQNIQGGVKLLAQLLNQFNGDTALALAAYNAGPGNVQKYGGIPPFAETQNYVASIMEALGLSPPDPHKGAPRTPPHGALSSAEELTSEEEPAPQDGSQPD
jgi:soluble lytic murein transglycosylase-like protein